MNPIACSLSSHDLAAQSVRWHELAARAFVARDETEAGLRLVFRADVGVAEELEQLLAVERDCCAWADWRLGSGEAGLVVDVCSAGEGITALRGMFTSLEA